MNTTRKQLIIFFSFATLVLVPIYLINSRMNVGGVFSSQEIYELTLRQKQWQTLVSQDLFDQRQWIKGMIHGQRRCPEVLVLGSSTVGIISGDDFPTKDFLNAWVTGPTIEDYESIAQMMRENECHPKNILIGVDPWLFNKLEKSDRWKSLLDYYWRYQPHVFQAGYWIEIIRSKWSVFKDRLSYVTTKQSFKKLWSEGSIQKQKALLIPATIREICDPEKTLKWVPFGSKDFYNRDYDGHYEACPQFLKSKEEVREIANTYIIRNAHSMAKWKEFDVKTATRMRLLLGSFIEKKINVVLFSPSYHPETYNQLMQNQKTAELIREMHRVLQSHARDTHVDYINMQDPVALGCTDTDFDDSHHAKRSCMVRELKMIAPLLKF